MTPSDTQDRADQAGHNSGNDNPDLDDNSHVGGKGNDRDVTVTMLAPNNASREMTVDLHDRVDKVAREAVKMFVAAHQMASMNCGLTHVVNGVATPLDDAARLEEVGVHKGSRLALVPKDPKTDG